MNGKEVLDSDDNPFGFVGGGLCHGAAGAAPNPASQNCVQQGGKLAIERDPKGGEVGVCMFEDNRQCEEWALLRGQCPKGGIRVTGYTTPEERFCAIMGRKYTTGECRMLEKAK